MHQRPCLAASGATVILRFRNYLLVAHTLATLMSSRSSLFGNRLSGPGGVTAWSVLLACGVFGVTLTVFLPVLDNGFVEWDDRANILVNPHFHGLTAGHLQWMFSSFHGGHYQPLTWITLAVDYLVHGLSPRGYHLTSILLHALNAVLLWRLLITLSAPAFPEVSRRQLLFCCALGALFWSVHPLRVESVAWVSERRDLVSGLFFLLALNSYLRGSRWLTLLFFTLSLLGKAWAITLPLVFILLDLYPLQRERTLRRLIVEKWPFLLLAALFALLAYLAQQSAGAALSGVDHPWAQRIAQSFYGLAFYPLKTVWPLHLSPLYVIQPGFDPLTPRYVLAAVGVLLVSLLSLRFLFRYPAPASCWLAYGVIVSPVLGLFQSGPQMAADRYSYLATIPFLPLLVGGLLVLSRWRKRNIIVITGSVTLTGIVAVLAILTVQQTAIWHDTDSLWTHAIELDERNYIAYSNRGKVRQDAGDLDAAMSDYSEAVELNPGLAPPHYNYANLLLYKGRVQQALRHYNAAVNLSPQNLGMRLQRAVALMDADRIEEARSELLRAYEVSSPNSPHRAAIESGLARIGDRGQQ